jgi:hypothetical protein
LKHVLIRDPGFSGYQFGVLRALEEAILQLTGADIIELPAPDSVLLKKAGHGMRFDFLRGKIPKKKLIVKADVLWCILMGPETFSLDLFTGWEKVKHRIVYLFDTYPSHYGMLRNLFSKNYFTIHVTAFNESRAKLEHLTNQKWEVVQHAGSAAFKMVPLAERVIGFSSYGRRMDGFHEALLDFCRQNNIYYDYTNHDGKHPVADPEELYRQYIWHVNHSVFNVSWPVELANPKLAGGLHPVTCRWFEASCAGTVLIGKKPANEKFDEYLFHNQVIEIEPNENKTEFFKKLDSAWSHKETHFQTAQKLQAEYSGEMIWENRVKKILSFI